MERTMIIYTKKVEALVRCKHCVAFTYAEFDYDTDDGNEWYEETKHQAEEEGWTIVNEDVYCPNCAEYYHVGRP